MLASSGDRTKYPTAFCLWLGLAAISVCVVGHIAQAADLTLPGTAADPAAVETAGASGGFSDRFACQIDGLADLVRERPVCADPPQPKLEIILGHDVIPR